MSRRIFALARAAFFAILFISLWMYFMPRWLVGPQAFDGPRPFGWMVVAAGAAVALPCIWQFAWRGLGTPAPFDPPRHLVVSGPYRRVRNPMYIGMGIVLIGEAIVFPSITWMMVVMVVVLWLAVNLLIIAYEEPTLRRMFGTEYEAYCREVRRWLPRLRPYERRTQNAE